MRVSKSCDADFPGRRRQNVANHPQSLWITLWTLFRGLLQVTYRKGFFFVRSNFERRAFSQSHQLLMKPFHSTRVARRKAIVPPRATISRRWIEETTLPAAFQRGKCRFPASYELDSCSPTPLVGPVCQMS